jgi:hypothetical protein
MNRCETRSISIAAPPSAVLDFVGDARTLPRWAPEFTRTVEPEGEHWRIDGGGLVDVRVSRERGTVDIVSAGDPRRGAFSRVIANGEGSEYLFTLQFQDGTSEDAVARQMAVVDTELRAVRDACQV